MRTAPRFWWKKSVGWQAALLSLVGYFYGRITGRRMLQAPGGEAPLPVICIGNFVLGGTGKTPFALRLADVLAEHGHASRFLLRGYGGREKGPLLVDDQVHLAQDIGDEALLLAAKGPTIVSADRVAGARLAGTLALGHPSEVLIMDDGFQNPALAKDITLVLVDAQSGLGNGLCFPAGPLRAPLQTQILKADALVVVGAGDAADEAIHAASRKALPIFRAKLEPVPNAALEGKPLYAFAGIGRPSKFFETLENLGLDVERTKAFADHHLFSPRDAEILLKTAEAEGLQLVTTSKDMMRLKTARHELFRWLSSRTEVLEVTMRIDGEERLATLIDDAIRRKRFRSRETARTQH